VCVCLFFFSFLNSIGLVFMDNNTFSLDEIRRELARLGYSGLSKETLNKFQNDLEELAEKDRAQSTIIIRIKNKTQIFNLDSYQPKRSTYPQQQQSNVDFQVENIYW